MSDSKKPGKPSKIDKFLSNFVEEDDSIGDLPIKEEVSEVKPNYTNVAVDIIKNKDAKRMRLYLMKIRNNVKADIVDC